MGKDDDGGNALSRIAKGLGDLLNVLTDLEQSGKLPHRGRQEKGDLVVEYTVNRGTLRRDTEGGTESGDEDEARQVRPARRRRAPKPAAQGRVEPACDVFDEADEVVILFELPGLTLEQIRCTLDGDILVLEAQTDTRHYRKELLVETALAGTAPRLRLANGVLDVRLDKARPGQ